MPHASLTPLRLSRLEIEAILGVAGGASPEEALKNPDASELDTRRLVDAFQSGMDKLRDMLERRRTSARTAWR